MTWLEEERADAVAIRLHVLARRTKPPAAPHQSGKPSLGVSGTDKPIYAGTHATLLNPAQPTDAQVHLNTGASGSSASQDGPKRGRIEVTTALQAGEVAAKRKANLEEKKLDKCPMCRQQHEYDKTWTQTTPPTVTKMVSTLLTSCPKFLAQSAAQKLVSVTSHAACPLCTSWEHPRHRFGGKELPEPKCKVLVQGVECGGKHGRWFHASSRQHGKSGCRIQPMLPTHLPPPVSTRCIQRYSRRQTTPTTQAWL